MAETNGPDRSCSHPERSRRATPQSVLSALDGADLAAHDRANILPKYEPAIAADNSEIVKDQDTIKGADQSVSTRQRQVEIVGTQVVCEAGGTSNLAGCQQGTGVTGQESVYGIRVSELQSAEDDLTAARAQANATRSSPRTADCVLAGQRRRASWGRFLHQISTPRAHGRQRSWANGCRSTLAATAAVAVLKPSPVALLHPPS